MEARRQLLHRYRRGLRLPLVFIHGRVVGREVQFGRHFAIAFVLRNDFLLSLV